MADPPDGGGQRHVEVTGAGSDRTVLSNLFGLGSIYTLGTIVQLAAALLVLPAVTRLLVPEQYGIVASGQLVVQVLAIIAALGVPAVITLEFFQENEGPRRSRYLIGLGLAVAVVIVIVADLAGPSWIRAFSELSYTSAIRLATWSAVAVVAVACVQALFQVARRPLAFVAVTLLATVGAQGAALASVALFEPTATAFFGGYLVGVSAAAVVGIILALSRNEGHRALRLSRSRLTKELVRAEWTLGLPTIFHSLALYAMVGIDRVIVERDRGLVAAGRYQIAYVLGALGLTVLSALNSAWAPLILASKPAERGAVLAETTAALQGLVAPLVAALSLGAPVALLIVAPASYDPTGLSTTAAVVALCAPAFLDYLSQVQIVFSARRTSALAFTSPLAMGVNVMLNVLLVPHFGLMAAAVVSVASYAVLATLVGRRARRMLDVPWDQGSRIRMWAGSSAAVGVAILLPADGMVWLGFRVVCALVAGAFIVHRGAGFARAHREPSSAIA